MEGNEDEHETEHIAEVMTSIGQQRQGILCPAYEGLNANKQQVQYDTEDEDAVHAGWHHVVMMMVMTVVVVMMMFIVMVVMMIV
jgi:ferritin-like metal-binding protein YciE